MKPFILALIYGTAIVWAAYVIAKPFEDNPVRMENTGKYEAETAHWGFMTACQKRNSLKDCVEAK